MARQLHLKLSEKNHLSGIHTVSNSVKLKKFEGKLHREKGNVMVITAVKGEGVITFTKRVSVRAHTTDHEMLHQNTARINRN